MFTIGRGKVHQLAFQSLAAKDSIIKSSQNQIFLRNSIVSTPRTHHEITQSLELTAAH